MDAEAISQVLGGHKVGGAWMARCPAHQDRHPSLSIANSEGGKVLVHCHAGCDQSDVIAALRLCGAWQVEDRREALFSRSDRGLRPINPDPDSLKRTEAALVIWRGSQHAEGTLVETYLQSRGLQVPLPPSIRFHAKLKHASGELWPAMVALVTRATDGVPIAIHRTFLARSGRGKAPIDRAKMVLGPCRGGVVRLASSNGVLMIGEGIETCLSAMQATGRPAWAALSAPGLRSLDLPEHVRDVTVLADGDAPGEVAALNCAQRCKQEGRRACIARPPRGMDFNDLLKDDAR